MGTGTRQLKTLRPKREPPLFRLDTWHRFAVPIRRAGAGAVPFEGSEQCGDGDRAEGGARDIVHLALHGKLRIADPHTLDRDPADAAEVASAP